ncbi:MAG: hypothetical protein ABI767_06745 [Rhodanobacter sp.]
MSAGILLMSHGELVLQSRWRPGTLALVHVLTLGVLGNATFDSVLQFLPAAASARIHGGRKLGHALHAMFNAGIILLLDSRLQIPLLVLINIHDSWVRWAKSYGCSPAWRGS